MEVLFLKVLIVDDESALLEQAKIFLERGDEELNVETTTSGEEGLEMIRNEDFDAVASDYLLPDLDGIDMLKKLRSEGNDIPFIIITGRDEPEIESECLESGANQFFIKSGNPKELYQELSKVIIEETDN